MLLAGHTQHHHNHAVRQSATTHAVFEGASVLAANEQQAFSMRHLSVEHFSELSGAESYACNATQATVMLGLLSMDATHVWYKS